MHHVGLSDPYYTLKFVDGLDLQMVGNRLLQRVKIGSSVMQASSFPKESLVMTHMEP